MARFKIGNELLFKNFERRYLCELQMDENFVVLPGRVWRAFVNWYGPTVEVKRKVISYLVKTDSRS